MLDKDKYVLCFVDGNRAFFTSKPLEEQWGSGWGKVPYEHNAGTPSVDEGKSTIHKVYFDLGGYFFNEPCTGFENSCYSVEDINKKKVPWIHLKTPNIKKDKIHWVNESVFAGMTYEDFKAFVYRLRGNVYENIRDEK